MHRPRGGYVEIGREAPAATSYLRGQTGEGIVSGVIVGY